MIDDAKFKASQTGRSADTSGVTLVAFFGVFKPYGLLNLIHTINAHISTGLNAYPGLFLPYSDSQIHATLCGMEGSLDSNGEIVNDSIKQRYQGSRNEIPRFEIDHFLRFFGCASWPIIFRFGGYRPIDANPYDLKRQPWNRSFEIRQDGLAVLMGWPVLADDKPFAPVLLGLRKYLESFGLAHKYHINPSDQDNDLFMVTGSIDYDKWKLCSAKERDTISKRLDRLQKEIRDSLAMRPIFVDLHVSDIRIVKYRRTTLEQVHFNERIADVAPDDIQKLYS